LGLTFSIQLKTNCLSEPDTGLETFLRSTNWTEGSQPLLKDMRSIPDFDFAARQHLDDQKYSFYRTAAAGEWSYRNNLEIWSKVKFRTRMLTDVTKVNETMTTTILGYNFSAPIFISPAARGAYGDPERAEINFVEAAASENILYASALYASKTIEEIGAAKSNRTMNGPQVTFQQARSLPPVIGIHLTSSDIHQRESLRDLGCDHARGENRRKSTHLDD
jgi:L-lactate dehydrogenase (cytochrome)